MQILALLPISSVFSKPLLVINNTIRVVFQIPKHQHDHPENYVSMLKKP